jgi:glycosyltransferase involved in cell wall biosynthesis
MNLSVVVCVRNEESRLRECLETVYANNPDEVILVDGDSSDGTVAIAREFPSIRIIESRNSSLTRDRQKGLDAARNDLVAMIDADHRLRSGDLDSLLADMKEFHFDIVQSCVISHCNQGFWDAAEEASWEVIHNIPGRRKNMIGVAPAIFHKRVFDYVRFDDHITGTIEDTDFAYQLSKFPELRFGVGRTRIRQYHFADFKTYVRKFQWYGKGDGEFCRKHPERAFLMLFHLLVRYPLLHSWKAAHKRHYKAIPIFILQGTMRFVGLVKYFIKTIK